MRWVILYGFCWKFHSFTAVEELEKSDEIWWVRLLSLYCSAVHIMHVLHVGYWSITQRSIPVFAKAFILSSVRGLHFRSAWCQFSVGGWRVSTGYYRQCQRHWWWASSGKCHFTITFPWIWGRNWRRRTWSIWPRPRQRNRHWADWDALEACHIFKRYLLDGILYYWICWMWNICYAWRAAIYVFVKLAF